MSNGDTHRKLAAIFSADVKGYSRLMGDDEAATVQTIKTYRRVLADSIQKHHGRVVDSPGDNLLAEFSSVVDAVQSALAIQQEIQVRNDGLPDHRRMEFRIGINVGDVITDDGRLYGDGVNIAARLEGLAEGGGICLSAGAYEQVKDKLDLEGRYLGQYAVKNISQPVKVWALLTDAATAAQVRDKRLRQKKFRRIAMLGAFTLIVSVVSATVWNVFLKIPTLEGGTASPEKMAFPLPDRPSIAVLPFDNLSGDPEQEYFSNGLTEELITALSKIPDIFVISQNSTFTYKAAPVTSKKVSEDLGVRYILKGSVQRDGHRVRVAAQLIDAVSGHNLWSERYDKELKDIFALQDSITFEITRVLAVKFSGTGEGSRLFVRGTDNLEAYLKFLRGRSLMAQFSKEGNTQAQQLAEEVIRLDPRYPSGYYLLATTTMMDVWLGISTSPRESLKKAIEAAQKTISLDDDHAAAWALLGFLYVLVGQHEKGLEAGELAVKKAPNSAEAQSFLAQILNFSGKPEDAVAYNDKAFRLTPVGRSGPFYLHAAHTFRLLGRYEDAIEVSRELLSRTPDSVPARVQLVTAYMGWGRREDARAAAQDVLRYDPKFSARRYAGALKYKDPALTRTTLEHMLEAGLPE
ncbi:MAG: tetratricopeptide repeat protein [Deferrisomatales bacterium]|nr:tetratricopeptide repeat protein [Deferrisomatales bacterium]